MKIDSSLESQLAALVEDESLELVAIEVVGSGPRTILRLVIDGPGGVSLDDCARVSRQASVMLDVEDPFKHQYTLEVSSPGLDRKLYSVADYDRYAGQRVRVRMKPGYRTHRTVIGELVGLERETLRLRLDSSETVDLPFPEVQEARLEVDWNSILKEGKGRR